MSAAETLSPPTEEGRHSTGVLNYFFGKLGRLQRSGSKAASTSSTGDSLEHRLLLLAALRLAAVQAKPPETYCAHCICEGVSGNIEQVDLKGKEQTSGYARPPKPLGGKKIEDEEILSAKNIHALTGILGLLE